MYTIAIPKMMPLGYGKTWIEGSIIKNETVDTFEQEYGDQQGKWQRMIKVEMS